MARWVRFEHGGAVRVGTLDDDRIAVHDGDMFEGATPTGETLPLDAVRLLAPVTPGKLIGLWNNFHERARKEGLDAPDTPLYFLKPASSFIAPGEPIRKPAGYDGRVVYEGELGIVIGRAASAVSAQDAMAHVFGYTCVNDVTAIGIIKETGDFEQWTRAKGFDTFCPIGPAVATDLDPSTLSVHTLLIGRERQNYPISDMIFPAAELVSRISHDMSLAPGDIISCGTSVGVLPMKPGSTVEIVIEGVGTLRNEYH